VASLLEVGTGFHPELTGRENIYLNGAVMGMSRAEIRRKFDEIVFFAEVEKFLDTPVKRYSSGMYVRLAFAVAAHLEPEILLVDEVLAVGDAAFQKKSLGKMGDVAKHGRTVIFVSHSMHAIQQLTRKCLYLEGGHVLDFHLTSKIVSKYLETTHREAKSSAVDLTHWQPRLGNNQAQLLKLEILDLQGRPTTTLPMFGAVKFRLRCNFPKKRDASFGILIHTAAEEPLLDLRNSDTTPPGHEYYGDVVVEATVSTLKMYPGEYLLSPWIADYSSRQNLDYVQYCSRITILPPLFEDRLLRLDPAWGKFYEKSAWLIS
jgi:lipopolysaccharide transport system ATP-binding protein